MIRDRSLDALLTGTGASLVDDHRRTEEPGLGVAVARLAGGLRDRGVRAGDVVTWQSPNRVEVAIAFRACWRIGAVAAPLHHLLGAAEVAGLRDRLAPTTVLDLDRLPDGDPITDLWTDAAVRGAVLFTSGSSGAPKGVVHTQATLAYKAASMGPVHGLGSDDVILMPAPCAHISGLLNGITLPGAIGCRTVFMARWDAEHALDLIEREGVTFMVGPPAFFVGLMDAPGFSPERVASLRVVSSGGSGVAPAFVERASRVLGARVKRTYGSTEAPTVATAPVDDDGAHDATHDGRAIGEVELRVDPVTGELLVRGPEVCVGYLDDAHDVAFDAGGWFHTGDRATIDAEGWLSIIGRLKDVIIRGGENIAAAEVESALEAHPDVVAAAVVGYPDERLGERVCAFVLAPHTFDVAACAAWFETHGIARFKTPERVVVLDSLPLLASGKPDKEHLRALAAERR